jgi:uncharacterized protein (DUF1501 family)
MRTRREFLSNIVFAAGSTLLASRAALPATSPGARLVVVLLRGALDGLTAAPPYGDPDYARLRRELVVPPPGEPNGARKLDGFFGLHPSLEFMHESYVARELVVVHAVATPYRDRSHFDGQDVLENGGGRPHASTSGWLNRALAALPAGAARGEAGIALGQNVPLIMRGPASVASWSPTPLASLDDDTLDRIADLYSGDPLLAKRLADALATNAIAGEDLRAAGAFLKREDGPRVAVFDTGGWDTHANQGAGGQGQLAARLKALDGGLRALKESLGPVWRHTAVLLVTEFGRTAAANGSRGTDHGTGTAAFLVGGAVNGGRVVADWPGLAPGKLHEGRDLRATLDLRAVFGSVLRDHLDVSQSAIDREVFPGSPKGARVTGLLRA